MVNIPANSDYLKGAIGQVKNAKTPPELRANVRQLKPSNENQVDIAQLSVQATKPQELKFHPEIPSANDDNLSLVQPGGNLATLFVLLGGMPEARGLVAAAAKEQQMIGGTAGA